MSAKTTRRGRERREHPRVDARLSMRVEGAPDDGAHAQIVTESQNISASGIYCTSSHFLAPLSKVALTIVLPRIPGTAGRQELVKCEGIVVRCEPLGKRGERRYELACMFSDLDRRRRELLEQFVTWRNLQALRAATAPRARAKPTRVAPNGRVPARKTTRAAAATPRRSGTAKAARSSRAPARRRSAR